MDQVRAYRWKRQRLDRVRQAPAAEVLEQAGWMRSVGGAGPYLGLFARAGTSREQVDADVAALKIHELPAARGCTYVVSAADFALALRAGQGNGEAADIATAKKFLGVKDAEIDKLCAKVVDALRAEALDPAQLKDALGPAVKHLGEAGKKRGVTTTLPLALGKLQSEGAIRRVPINGRLDQQRYRYARWGLKLPAMDDTAVAHALGERFFRWAGPATVQQFAWWAGISVKAAKAAAQELKLVAFENGELMSAADLDELRATRPEKEPRVALVGLLDNLVHLRRELASLTEAADMKRIAREKKAGGALLDLPSHAIVSGGRVIGLWEYDAAAAKIVYATFGKATPAVRRAVEEMETFVRDQLGDARQFSLDSPESRVDRLEGLRRMG